jgi:hypothetical protein
VKSNILSLLREREESDNAAAAAKDDECLVSSVEVYRIQCHVYCKAAVGRCNRAAKYLPFTKLLLKCLCFLPIGRSKNNGIPKKYIMLFCGKKHV